MSYYNPQIENIGFEKQKNLIEKRNGQQIIVVDIGGHVGESIEKYRLLFPDCTIYSFEPHPESFNTLEKRYKLLDEIFCEQLALGSKLGTATFYTTKYSAASSLLPPEEFLRKRSAKKNYDFSEIEVPVATLDHVARRHSLNGIDILKIDVQGSELEVLKGAASLLREACIDLIYTEVQFAETYAGQSDLNGIWNYLKNFGYVLWDLFPFVHTTMGRLWTANAIFISSKISMKIDPH